MLIPCVPLEVDGPDLEAALTLENEKVQYTFCTACALFQEARGDKHEDTRVTANRFVVPRDSAAGTTSCGYSVLSHTFSGRLALLSTPTKMLTSTLTAITTTATKHAGHDNRHPKLGLDGLCCPIQVRRAPCVPGYLSKSTQPPSGYHHQGTRG